MIKFNLKPYVLSKTFYLQIEQSKYIFNFYKNFFFILEKNDFSINKHFEGSCELLRFDAFELLELLL